MEILRELYRKLMDLYGPQGWWPLIDRGDLSLKYHPGDYSPPSTDDEIFQIIVGCVLTQNTSWKNAARALIKLVEIDVLDPTELLSMDDTELHRAIRCAGFYRQKARYLREVSEFLISLEGSIPSREELLSVRGVGHETADSILLYAYNEPEFVIDAYTRRIIESLGILRGNENYLKVKRIFEDSLEKDYRVFQEYHALMVRHGKLHYSRKPYGAGDKILWTLNSGGGDG